MDNDKLFEQLKDIVNDIKNDHDALDEIPEEMQVKLYKIRIAQMFLSLEREIETLNTRFDCAANNEQLFVVYGALLNMFMKGVIQLRREGADDAKTSRDARLHALMNKALVEYAKNALDTVLVMDI